MLPQPMVFLPRSTIRLQVEERSQGVTGRLFITLQGYKVLGLAGAAEEETRRLAEFEPIKKTRSTITKRAITGRSARRFSRTRRRRASCRSITSRRTI